ncbi:Endo-1,4-beta-xylanase A precursor [Pelotomaculum schinkii]|uniref:Endo-1,4-beta-xylanase A n=1 Tax=Pelotomaculum schinkii TaxID=78350 RepID=A0A4Y7R761_9FIRM|nr:S-layer homology domain-containing protein [Pelotomaculum schinkii]TEB04582.1 Endo-1,4-beta-xylanase A precursor [Pelotomaculum schinkii]
MPKKMHLILFIAAFAAVMIFSGALSSEAGGGQLLDIGEASWAEQEITEMSALEILEGYPDGRFLPYQSVTRLEAVAMLIRTLGLDDQARAMEEADVAYQVPYLPWGRGYLIMGVERGMLDKNYLNQLEPTGAATRAQVAALVCLAFDLSATGSSLDFADADQIPYGYQEYVAALVDNGLMQGLPGNVFEPNSVINRAQMAVLLSNLLNKELADPYPDRRITGTVSNIEPISGLIDLQEGASKFLTAECRYYLDGKKVEAAGIKNGDAVKLTLDDGGQVVLVQAARSSEGPGANQGQVYQGLVDNVFFIGGECWVAITCLDGTKITRSAPSSVMVNDPSGQMSLAGLSAGKYIEMMLEDNQITSINVLSTSTVKGKVTDVESSILTITSGGSRMELEVPGGVAVLKDNSAVSYDTIAVNNEVEVAVYGQKAIKIVILRDTSPEGTIEELDGGEITIRDVYGYINTYTLDEDVEVIIDGDSEGLGDLNEGDKVRLELNSRNYVTDIEVLDSSESDLEGEIRDLDTTGAYGITIRNSDGDKFTYKVVEDVDVYKGSRQLDFDELETGDEVRLELDSDGWVDEIEVLDYGESDLEGEIRDLDTTGAYGITIRNSDGDKFTYKVVEDVDVYKGSRQLDFDELEIGDEVRLELDSDDWVDEIEVLDSDQSTEEGVISGLRTGSSPRLWLTNSDGDEERYDISDDVDCDRDGDSIDLEEIVIGSEAEIEIEDDEVVTIEITDDEDITIEGEIIDVRVSSERIQIEQSSGNQFTYYLEDGAILRDSDGDRIDLEDVEEGWDVELRLRDGQIYRLTEL